MLDIRAQPAQETVALLQGEHRAIEADVSDSASLAHAFEEVDKAFGGVDILVNNAGVDRVPGDGFDQAMWGEIQLLHMSDEAFRRTMSIDVDGVFYGTREAVRLMTRDQRPGAIVNMSSIAGLAGRACPTTPRPRRPSSASRAPVHGSSVRSGSVSTRSAPA